METLQLIVVIFLGRIPLHDACAPNQGFFAISNKPAKGRKPGDFFVYAVHTGSISSLDEIEIRKDDLGLTCDLTLTGEIRTSYSYLWGCYLQLGTPDKDKASRFGTFTVTHSSGESVNTFIRRKTKLLDTKGVYTVTVYPKAIGSTELAESGDNSIGIVCKYNCHTIEWFKGNKRLNNTGPQMTINSTEDAGVYTIRRRNRAMKHWFVQIEVIVARRHGSVLNEVEVLPVPTEEFPKTRKTHAPVRHIISIVTVDYEFKTHRTYLYLLTAIVLCSVEI